jgi:hypothetical protein
MRNRLFLAMSAFRGQANLAVSCLPRVLSALELFRVIVVLLPPNDQLHCHQFCGTGVLTSKSSSKEQTLTLVKSAPRAVCPRTFSQHRQLQHSGNNGHLGGQANITKDFLKVLGRCPEYGKCSSPHRFRATRMLTGTVVSATSGDALD